MERPLAIVTLLVWFALSGALWACPDPQAEPLARHEFTGRDLWSPERVMIRAGGPHALIFCGGGFWGYAKAAPDALFDLTRMRRFRRLHLRSFAPCDTVLLLRDPLGSWYFDDDSGVGRTASLSLAAPVDGAYAVWVGTVAEEGCEAELALETF